MIYPQFLKKGDTIGISAPSAGVGRKLDSYDASIENLHKQGYQTVETESVRVDNLRSTSKEKRAEELVSLFNDKNIKMVMAAAGGDFLSEILPYVDFQSMKRHPKWLMGASDPTGILFPYTTKYDVATIYGLNAGSYDETPIPKYIKNNLELLKGNLIEQKSFPKYMKAPSFAVEEIIFDTPVKWLSQQKEIHTSGRCIGGCIDVLKDLIGTPFDGAKKFVKKYEKDGVIWFFDNFSLSAEMMYRTLLQMRYAGWFENAKAIVIGRTLFESSETGMSYEEGFERALEGIPYVYEADVGHTHPHMTMIMGSIMHLDYARKKAKVSFELK